MADFDKLRNGIANNTRVAPPSYGRIECTFILTTDSSKYAVGAVVYQMQPVSNGTLQRKVVSIASRMLTEAEQKWGTSEMEALAVIFGQEKYRRFIASQPIILETEHSALRHYLLSGKANSGWLNRLLLIIQGYNIVDVHYVQGETNVAAEALSRLQVDRYIRQNVERRKAVRRLPFSAIFVCGSG